MDPRTIETYNLLADDYDAETAEFWAAFPHTFLDAFSERVAGKILNVGSGPGRDALLLEERGLEMVCLDASEAMVRLAQERGLGATLGDFKKMEFPDASFDGVWAYTSLLHTKKDEIPEVLAEIRRVLKPGGTFGLGMIEGDWEGYRESSGVGLPRWFAFYVKPELERLLRSTGFDIVYFEEFQPKSKKYLNFVAIRN